MIIGRKFTASGAITACRIVAFGAGNHVALQAADPLQGLIGVYVGPADAIDAQTDCLVCMLGECNLEVAGAVGRGELLSSNGDGKGVPVTASSGVNNRVIAMALESGTNTVLRVLVLPGLMQGA